MAKKKLIDPSTLSTPYDANLAALRLDLDADDIPSSVRDAGRALLDGLRDSLGVFIQHVAVSHPAVVPPPLSNTVEPRLVNDEDGSWWIVLHPFAPAPSRRGRKLPANRLVEGLAEIALRIPEHPTPQTPIEIRTRFLTFEAMMNAAKTLPKALPDLLAMPMVTEGLDKMVAMMPGMTADAVDPDNDDHGLPN